MKPKKIAVVAEWLTWRGGGETVLDAILEAYPDADLYTTVYNEQKLPEYKKFHPKTSFLQKIPFVNKKHQLVPPLLLKAIESINLEGHDLIISLSSSIGKGITKPKGSIHVCYCHTPMRYLWQSEIDNRLVRIPLGKYFVSYLKKWDLSSNKSVDFFLTNSKYTAERIERCYSRKAHVIYPPVDVAVLQWSKNLNEKADKEDFYLCLSRLVAYKKFDLAIKAFNKLGKKLVVAGDGPEKKNLMSLAQNNIEFVGRVSHDKKKKLLASTQALIFPADEDFGIVPVEAMSQGTPVIAFGKGGVTESVIEGKTGIFFKEQSVDSLKDAVEKFEKMRFDRNEAVNRAQIFSKKSFIKNLKLFIEAI